MPNNENAAPGVWCAVVMQISVETSTGLEVIPWGTDCRLVNDADLSDLRPTFENLRLAEQRRKCIARGHVPAVILHAGRFFVVPRGAVLTEADLEARSKAMQ